MTFYDFLVMFLFSSGAVCLIHRSFVLSPKTAGGEAISVCFFSAVLAVLLC